jgi:hypothetical protein
MGSLSCEVVLFMLGLAAGDLGDDDVASWLRSRMVASAKGEPG